MISVVLTCYNDGPYIEQAVRSVLQQTRADLIENIVIADDGSDGRTVEILKKIEHWDARIVVIYGPGGKGPAEQRNLAVARCTGKLLALLDGDDHWASNKLELQIPAMANPEIGLSYTGYFTFEDSNASAFSRAPVEDLSASSDLPRAYFLNDPPVITSTMLIRRDAFDRCGGFDSSIRVFEDTDFCIRLARQSRFTFVPEPLLYKRSRPTSITGGRRDLMAHHAFVALKAAAVEPRLFPLVTRRLAERARKLGNQRLLSGDFADARELLKFGARLQPFNPVILASLVIAFFPRQAQRLICAHLAARKATPHSPS